MKVLILTSVLKGYACACLPIFIKSPNIDLAGVVLAKASSTDKKRFWRRRLKKISKIGILGALNGIRMRKWYQPKISEDIISLAEKYNVPLFNSPVINSDQTRSIFKKMNVDLGLSLGNGYIAQSVFSIPKYGMINVHTEVLPDFQNAQSIIWPIYEGINQTGFTIHQIEKRIDAGDILYQKKYSITFYLSLKESVEKNLQKARSFVPEALCYVCENYHTLRKNAKKQTEGRKYTTPTIRQYLRMLKNHRRMKRMYSQQ